MEISDKINILLSTIDRQWSQAIQSENQRANLANFLLTLYGASQAYIIQREYDSSTIIVSIVLIFLSIYGILATYKYYERFRLHTTRVGRLMDKLDELEPSISLNEIEKIADTKHKTNFPRLSKIRLFRIWLFLHYGFSILGFINLIIAILKNVFEIELIKFASTPNSFIQFN